MNFGVFENFEVFEEKNFLTNHGFQVYFTNYLIEQ
jgi:hypothetical protein